MSRVGCSVGKELGVGGSDGIEDRGGLGVEGSRMDWVTVLYV
jgi:hypothetical protein